MGDGAASMFAGKPQPVEIHHRGIWYSGELIGWRHERTGRVAARVRCVVDGLRHSAWMDLADLRLPDPHRPPHKEPFPAVVRRPVPVCTGDEDEATRPHALLAGLGSRPARPAHTLHPPATRDPLGAPGLVDAARWGDPLQARRTRDLAKADAYLALA